MNSQFIVPFKNRDNLSALLILMVCAFVLFANTFSNGWTMDDFPVLVENPDIRSLGAFLTNSYPGRPLREITFLIDHAFFGLDPAGYHIQNIFWHGLNAWLVFLLLTRLCLDRPTAWFGALLFLVHPVQVEVVANISHRKDSLALCFCLLAMLVYMKIFEDHRKSACFFGALSLGLLATLAKQTAVALPVVFAAYELAYVRREERILTRYPRMWLAALAAGAVALLIWLGSIGGMVAVRGAMQFTLVFHANYFDEPGFSVWYAMVLKSWLFMVCKLVLPVDLAVEYLYPAPQSWLDPWVTAALLGVAAYGIGVWYAFRRQPVIFFGLVWFGAFFLPVSNLLPVAYLAADRYLYEPMPGFVMLTALLLARLLHWSSPARYAAMLLIIFALAGLTWRQNGVWRSHLTLYSRAVEVSPKSTFALHNLGWEYFRQERYADAYRFLRQAVDNNPHYPRSLYGLALVCEKTGDRQRAVNYYLASLRKGRNIPGFEPVAEQIREHIRREYGVRSE